MPIMSKDITKAARDKHLTNLSDAIASGDPKKMETAMAAFCADLQADVIRAAADEFSVRNRDNEILAGRGATVLTSAELNYYEKLAAALKSDSPKAALENFEVAMPEEMVDRVMDRIRQNHPLLDALNFSSASYQTTFILNAAPAKTAKWGKITGKITEEITGGFKAMSLIACKLTAFMAISKDLLELGPVWLDRYTIEFLSESIAIGAEVGAVSGTGNDEPIGMIRNVADNVSVTGGVYPEKDLIALNDLSPESMGDLVSKLCVDPLDATAVRNIDPRALIFIVHPLDYWQKIMPATTHLVNGVWMHDILPIPAKVFQSTGIAQGKAVLGLGNHYELRLGPGGKKGVITQDDSVRFLDDERVTMAKLLGNGRPIDNNSFLYLDISGLIAILPVKVQHVDDAVATA